MAMLTTNPQDKMSEDAFEATSSSRRGWKHTPETKAKMRKSHLGRGLSEETKRKIGVSNRGKGLGKKPHNFGSKASKELKKKLSVSHQGKPWSSKRRATYVSQASAPVTYNSNCRRCKVPVVRKLGRGNVTCDSCRVSSRLVEKPGQVKCEVCGLFYKTLLSHVVLKHRLSPAEYKNQFPEAPLRLYKQTMPERARRKIGEAQIRYRENGGTHVGMGSGKGSFYQTPYQGRVWLRSSSEVQRAIELDSNQSIWFYEARRYPLLMGGKLTTYTPDFWVVSGSRNQYETKIPESILDSVSPDCVSIEDVKGWWSVKHPSSLKVQAFREQYPNLRFEIVVRKGFVWGAVGSPSRDLAR